MQMVPGEALSSRSSAPGRHLTGEVAKQIRLMIMSGRVGGGERLRTEHLAQSLGVSATPVREALMTLAGEGMVRFDPGKGFSVIPLRRQDILDVYGVQAHLSGELAARAASMIGAEDIGRLEMMQDGLVRAVDAGAFGEAQRIDFEQHRLINKVPEAPKLAWMLGLTLRYVPFEAYADIPGWPAAGRDDHAAVFAGFRTGNPLTARDAMRAHIRHAGDLLIDLLDQQGVLAKS